MSGPDGATPGVTRVLVVRTDNDGDVLLVGPAVRAVARDAEVTLLVSPSGERAARLLPGVADVLVWPCPWSGFDPPPVEPASTQELLERVRDLRPDAAVVHTSFHQSPLPTALLLRLAGVPRISATSVDYPGSLLDVRHRLGPDDDRHEVERALDLAAAAGYPADPDDDTRLRLREPLPAPPPDVPHGAVVVHPGASVPARAPRVQDAAAHVAALVHAGHDVVLTGGPEERSLTAEVAARAAVPVTDLGGRTDLADLAAVLRSASCVVVGNTGPAHLAAAVGTPVVSLFAPVVGHRQWAPWRVPSVLLGDQEAPCAGSRARQCPVPGHPCLASVTPAQVVAAVEALLVAAPTDDRAEEVAV